MFIPCSERTFSISPVQEILPDWYDATLHAFIKQPQFLYSRSVAPFTRNFGMFYDSAEEVCTINTDWNDKFFELAQRTLHHLEPTVT